MTGPRRSTLESVASQFFSEVIVEAITVAVAEEYTGIRVALRQQGAMIPEADLWIAATALSFGYILVTRDAHFSRVPGLVVEDWSG